MNQGTKRSLTVGALVSAGLIVVGGTPLAFQALADHGYDVPTLSTPQSLLALLDARSPGERAKGALTATKVKKVAANNVHPHERALGKIVRPAPTAPADFVEALIPPAATDVAPPLAPAPTLAEVLPKVTGTPGNAPPGGTTLVGGPGGGSPGGGSPGTPGAPGTPQTPDVPSAVPEPATWLTMLIGFGVIGAAQRRRRHALPGSARLA